MHKALTRIIPALIFLGVSHFAFEARACSCAPRPSIYKRYSEATAVFIGKTIASKDVGYKETLPNGKEYTYYQRLFRFSVTESFKGIKAAEVWVDVGRIDSSCFSGFGIGESYLVFAYGESEKDLGSGMCSGSREVWDAAAELHYIRELLKGVPESRVYGSVMRRETIADGGNRRDTITPIQGIKILIEGEGKQFEAVTDKQGFYRIEKIPDGTYTARPVLPDHYTTYLWPEEEFILGTPKKWIHTNNEPGPTAHISFTLAWKNGVKGRIVDSEGNVINRAKVTLMQKRGAAAVIIHQNTLAYPHEGKFWFNGLTPGRYFLCVDIRAPFEDNKKPTRFYYPNSDSLAEAEEIKIGEREALDDREIRLPPGYLLREIEGVVVWPNGVPVADAWVVLAGSKDSADDADDDQYDWKSTDALGRFSLEAFVGAEYWVRAKSRGSGKGEPVKIKIYKSNEPLKIILPFPKESEP